MRAGMRGPGTMRTGHHSQRTAPARLLSTIGNQRHVSAWKHKLGGAGHAAVVRSGRGMPPRQAQSQSLATGTVVKVPGTEQEIRWGSALSRETLLSEAMDEAVASIMNSVGQDAKPDVALVFASSTHGEEFEQVVPMLRERLPSLRTIFGCSGFGVVGGSDEGPLEVEGEHAFSLTLGQLPGANVRVLHTLRSSIPDENASPEEWAQFVGVPHEGTRPTSFLVFADPRFVQVRELIAGLDYAFPDSHKIGSILSSGTKSKSRAMWAWSASGPSNASGSSSGATVSRRRGRSSLRRNRSSGDLSGASPSQLAAAVMAVMGKAEGPRGKQSETYSVEEDTEGDESSSGETPPEIQILSGGSSKTGSQSTGGGSASTSGTGKAADSGEDAGGSRWDGPFGFIRDIVGPKAGGRKGASSDSSTQSASGSRLGGTDRSKPGGAAKAMFDAMARWGAADEQRGAGKLAGSVMQGTAQDVPSNGMYLYGAIVLAIQGEVQLDVITSMGYRAPSPRIWRIHSVSGSNHIVTLIPEELAMEAGQNGGQQNGLSASSRGRVISREVDSDDDSEEEEDSSGPEVQALAAVVDMLDALTENQNEVEEVLDEWDELLDTAVVAVAADNGKPASELGPEDWELLPLQEIVEEYGVLVVGDPPVVGGGVDLRRGNRIQLLVRDARGVREDLQTRLLDYKRRDLASMLEGRALPPTFGALLLTDVDRGMDCYDKPNYESSMTHSYVPTPISGVFGGAQIAPLQSSARATAILEYSAVVGVFRAATDRSKAAVKAEAAARLQGTGKEPIIDITPVGKEAAAGMETSAGKETGKGKDKSTPSSADSVGEGSD